MFSALDDREVDDLLAGVPTADADLAPMTELVAALRRSVIVAPAPRMSAALRAQLTASPITAISARRAGRSSMFKAAAVAAAVAVVALGVGASQNRLPTLVQDVVSSTADLVGIQVPTVAERGNSDTAPNGNSDTAPNGNSDSAPNGNGNRRQRQRQR